MGRIIVAFVREFGLYLMWISMHIYLVLFVGTLSLHTAEGTVYYTVSFYHLRTVYQTVFLLFCVISVRRGWNLMCLLQSVVALYGYSEWPNHRPPNSGRSGLFQTAEIRQSGSNLNHLECNTLRANSTTIRRGVAQDCWTTIGVVMALFGFSFIISIRTVLIGYHVLSVCHLWRIWNGI